jgi:hypothetical protein
MTAVLEKSETFTDHFDTEPYETGWASEARWFIRLQKVAGENTVLRAYPQISPDGLFWCDEGSQPLVMSQEGLYSFALRDFGQWLRLRCEVEGQSPSVMVLIYLALKA